MDPITFVLVLVLLVPLLLITRRTRRAQRAFVELQARLAAGQRVMTTSGLFGQLAVVEDDEVELDIAPGVRVRWAKAAISRIVEDETGDASRTADRTSTLEAQRPTSVTPDDGTATAVVTP